MRLPDVNEGCTPGGALAPTVWSDDVWRQFHAAANEALRNAPSSPDSRRAMAPLARRIIRAFSSSFFIVTRFLPPAKRRDVEIIYANVRYPDEVVDSLPLSCNERLRRLDAWQRAYEAGLAFASASDAVRHGVEALPAAFAEIVRTYSIPTEHYLPCGATYIRVASHSYSLSSRNMYMEAQWWSAIGSPMFSSLPSRTFWSRRWVPHESSALPCR